VLRTCAVLQIVTSAALLFANYFSIPDSNTNLTHFDTISCWGLRALQKGSRDWSSANACRKVCVSTKPVWQAASS
jgi:hypothetical protein